MPTWKMARHKFKWRTTRRYISNTLGVEYLEIPKCACTSIKLAILESDGIKQTRKDIDNESHWLSWCLEPKFRFTFVRHPVARFISVFRNKIRRGYFSYYGLPFPQRNATPYETLVWIQHHLSTAAHPDKHFQLQTSIRNNRHHPKPRDYIGHFETLAEEWKKIQAAYRLPDLSHQNKSEGAVELDRPTLDLLYQIYQPDFQTFGYSLEEYNAS
jgi:hypothetical protein